MNYDDEMTLTWKCRTQILFLYHSVSSVDWLKSVFEVKSRHYVHIINSRSLLAVVLIILFEIIVVC